MTRQACQTRSLAAQLASSPSLGIVLLAGLSRSFIYLTAFFTGVSYFMLHTHYDLDIGVNRH